LKERIYAMTERGLSLDELVKTPRLGYTLASSLFIFIRWQTLNY